MKQEVKSVRKAMRGVYWKLHDKRERLVAGLKGYLDGLPPETRRRAVPGILAAFTVLALYTFDGTVYGIGRSDDSHIETGYTRRMELPAPVKIDNRLAPHLYGTDEE